MALDPKTKAQIAANHRREREEQNEARKDRTARYKSSAMTAKLEESRLAHHDEINKRQERSMASFRRKIESKRVS
jgi:hypothetical protein